MENELLGLMRMHDMFHGLDDDEIAELVDSSEVVDFDAGEIVLSVGERLNSLYLVVKGRLKLTLKTPGGEQRTVRYVSAGDQLGAISLFTGDDFPFRATVEEPAVMLRISHETAYETLDRFPNLRKNLLKQVGLGVQNAVLTQRKRTLAKVVSFIHADDDTRAIVGEIAQRLASCEKIGVLCDSEVPEYDSKIPLKSLRNPDGSYINEPQVREIVKEWADIERVFLVVDRLHPREKLARLVELSDIVFCMSTTKNSNETIGELRQLYLATPSWKSKTHFVWVLKDDEQIVPLVPELSSLVERDFKVHLAQTGELARLRKQGVTRIVHYLRGVSVGLALSGGAAHGMAHLGVLKALDEAGITIDRIAGTSAGVLTGVVYCSGLTPDWGVEHFTEDLEPGSIYKKLPKGDGFFVLRKYRGNQWDPMLRKYFDDWRLEQLPIPLSTVTTDLISAGAVIRRTGDAVDSILESINLPILSEPICRDGMLLMDGGFVNNLPCDLLVKDGCNFVIGVDVSEHVEHKVGDNTPSTPKEKMKMPGIVATLMRCLQVQAHNLGEVGARAADLIIAPDVSHIDPTAFVKAPEMSVIGYETTQRSMARIREGLANLDSGLFGKNA